VKECDTEGPEVCSTEYQAECETVQHEHDVEDDVAECRNEIESQCEDVASGYTASQKCSNWLVQKCDVKRKQVKKYSPQTSCKKVAVDICGPSSCPSIPEEECSLEPKRVCRFVTKLVPQLKPHESCLDVPKKVCVRTQTNPRKVQKQIIKTWCYTPSDVSGLDNSNPSVIQDQSFKRTQPTPQQCPSNCRDAIINGDCEQSCDTYSNICGACIPKTTPPPPKCPVKCYQNW
jgi:hypothetical protein